MRGNLYSLEALIDFAAAIYSSKVTASSDISKQDTKAGIQRDQFMKYDRDCSVGDLNDKLFVKQVLYRILTDCKNEVTMEYPSKYGVTKANIDEFIDWKSTDLDSYLKYLAMLQHYENVLGYGPEAFGQFLEAHHLNILRKDKDGSMGFFVESSDIDLAWKKEHLAMEFDAKMDVLTQLVYEEIKGNSCIDELLYQNLGDISIGVSGIPNAMFANEIEPYTNAFDTCWVRYKGCSIHLRFLTFGSYEKMKDVVRRGMSYQMKGQFSEREGFKLGYAKDGSRRTAAIEPFGESPALWVRKFTARHQTNDELLAKLPGFEKVMDVEKILVQGGATIPVCGAQGSGKTTKLEAIAEYIQPFYAIRVMESEFEARLRWKYPRKNIFTVEANENTAVSPADAYNFSLRTAGDIYIIGEARGDDSIVNVTRTANRGGRSVLFTFHPNSPKATIAEIANALIRQKMYANLKDAVATALDTVHCCIYVRMDIEAQKRYYEIYEFVPRPNGLPSDFMQKRSKEEREAAFMETVYRYLQYMTSADIYYDTVPLVAYDREQGRYVYRNTISEAFFEELMDKTPLAVERDLLMRTFRPEMVLDKYFQNNGGHVNISQDKVLQTCKELGLNMDLLNVNQYCATRQDKEG
ncbi:hypothetical protein DXA92_13005 [Agathobaculum butyriciproducens]|nr:hypothetical protein DXA94_03835 [Agathobaculum butyriciproducens]RGC58880.1 hypothetical protein DXA92_13005 [Agathobaculum butyriciproducens]